MPDLFSAVDFSVAYFSVVEPNSLQATALKPGAPA